MLIPPPVPTVSASPAPSASPRQLKTIVTVISSPYCNSLAEHFNGAMVPMLGNDKTLDQTSDQLEEIDTLYSEPNYAQLYLRVRDKIGREVTALNASMGQIQQQINELRAGEQLTNDVQAAHDIHMAAQELQRAYDRQHQLAIDLSGVHETMLMDYNISTVSPPPMGGFSEVEMTEPINAKNIKIFLHFDPQRAIINDGENKAVDIAYKIAQERCTK